MVRESIYSAAGVFMMIVGAMVLGISAGMGFVSFMVKSRLPCIAIANTTSACHDIVDPASTMITVSAVGGFIAFAAGMLAVGLLHHGGNDD